ncbi:hypothetical protein [Alkalicoccus chagannorensis]|uniref:hypothetical protein n=1 Tax=Alkalicoccus chagannorensis TaxID=427072 RepID=UPI000410F6D5|nr:hypothetical protein [Alkalicoccus chagannorensis]
MRRRAGETGLEDVNQPEQYELLTEEQQDALKVWIRECLEPHTVKNYTDHITSYGLKHRFQYSNIGFYVSNGAMKGAMEAAGFSPKSRTDLNWKFKLGKKAGLKRDVEMEVMDPLGV